MKTQIGFDDFLKLDLRIGTVVEATVPEWSHWVMKLKVDFGPAFAKATAGKRQRTVFAGIMKFYQPEELIGKQFAFVVNLPPKKIGPKEADGTQGYSEAMLLAACEIENNEQKAMSNEGGEEKPIPLIPSAPVGNGTSIR